MARRKPVTEPPEETEEGRDRVMSLGDHLEELRKRLLIIIAVLVVFSSVAGIFVHDIHRFLTEPYRAVTTNAEHPHGLDLMLGSVMDSLDTMIQLSVAIGFTAGLPICIFVLFGFIAPALSGKAAFFARISVAFSSILFWSGLAFCWYYLFPITMKMMFEVFLPPGTMALISLEKYYSFFFVLHLGCGLTFQMPLLIVILGAAGIITVDLHKKAWRFVIIGIFIFAAIVTPPDPISQLVVAFPLVIFYGVAVLIVWIIERRRYGSVPTEDRITT